MSSDVKELSLLCKDLKLLYVEDDEIARETTLKLLEHLFQEITVAVDGLDGLNKFNKNDYDLILSDISMPKLTGLEMLESIRKKNEEIPVILLSAFNESQYFLKAIELNIDGYIVKPLNLEHFMRLLRKVTKRIKLVKLAKNYQDTLEKEVEKSNEDMVYKLHFDALTGLYSRYSFFRDIKELNTPVVLLIDIDKFKVINEVYGNAIGSEVLKKFAIHLSLAVDENHCSLYRLSSDEFAIVDKVDYIDPEKYENLLSKLFNELNNIQLKVAENIITIDITVGLSSVEHHSYESAKIALDYAKENKKPYVMYSAKIDHRKETSLTLQRRDDISSAINNDRVKVVYQPIVDKDENVVKHETLMRLEEEETLKLITPFHFLDVAIKTRLYPELSSIVMQKTLEKLRTSEHKLSVNLTYTDIKNERFIQEIIKYLESHDDVGKRIIIEITESESISNYEDVKIFIQEFRAYGVEIAIDDFGSGFSNFEYILEIEPDYLKIDGSLVKDIDTNTKSLTLVEAIVQFSHKLGIKVIAEFVHSKAIFDILKGLDVDEYQGFYFSEPLVNIDE